MRTSALAYFALALGWSFALWAASVWWGPVGDPTASPLFLAGGAGPLVAALLCTHLREPRAVRRDYWLRLVDVRRVRGRWLAASLLLHPGLVALALAIDLALGGAMLEAHGAARSLTGLLGLAFFVLWFGPLPEEMGWRGFALDRLERRLSPLHASLVLGSVWALWHVPLFYVPGTFQQGLGAGSVRFWIFLLSLLPLSVLMTWIYDRTSRSTLSAVLVHTSGNLCGALVEKSDRVAGLELLLLSVVAAVVVLSGGAADRAAWRRRPASV